VTPFNEAIFLSKFPFEIIFCGYVYIENVVTTTTPTTIIFKENSSTINATIRWDLLAKNQDFWKTKNYIATTWAFYAPCSSIFLRCECECGGY